jgi:hypothetical protein
MGPDWFFLSQDFLETLRVGMIKGAWCFYNSAFLFKGPAFRGVHFWRNVDVRINVLDFISAHHQNLEK